AVNTLERGGEQSLLAEALTTHGIALARLGRPQHSRAALERAVEVARTAGDSDGAGQAALALIEELNDHLNPDELRALYESADDLLARSQHAVALSRLRSCARTVVAAGRRKAPAVGEQRFVYAAERTAELLRDANSIAGATSPVLITGETGTGKELLARLIHAGSGRAGQFVTVNCAALNDTLFESQLFGHKKGSFTDAVDDYPGAARAAAGGTLFLDEIAELSHANQGKLLRLIDQGEIHCVGAPLPERVDLRIIAATNSSLIEMVAKGRFREDLYYRLETFHLDVPPLRERRADIPALAASFIDDARRRYANKRVTFTPEAVGAMERLPLRGNVRELRGLIERTMLVAVEGATVTAEMVEMVALRQTQKASLADPWAGFSLKEEVHRFEQRFIELALRDAGGMVSHAARLPGFKHHESLNSLLKTRYQNLLHARMPVTPRRRSVMRKYTH
ncbi:MAG: sigma 54-interacting transcriptional regulator, partial [Pyrinomonadaceae bacterium]